MRRLTIILPLLYAGLASAETAQEFRAAGIQALRRDKVVEAAEKFAAAAEACEKEGDEPAQVEANSFLYWCRKKLTRNDLERTGKNVAARLEKAVAPVAADRAQVMFNGVELWAKMNPDEQMAIAVRYFEIADRFPGTPVAIEAQRRSLAAQQAASSRRPASQPAAGNPPPTQPTAANDKLPIPDTAKQRDAENEIKRLFKDDLAKRAPADRKALAEKLFQQGLDTRDDDTARFVLLAQAADVAAQVGEAALVLKTVDEQARLYATDPLALKDRALGQAERAVLSKDAAKAVAEGLLAVADEAAASEKYDLAARLCARAETAARTAVDMPLLTKAQTKGKEAREIQLAADKVRDSKQKLATNPDDPEANLAVGKYECFAKGNWAAGLGLLRKGSDPVLKVLAEREQVQPDEPAKQVEIADGWWDYGAKQTGATKTNIQKHAVQLYEQLVPKLSGMTLTRVQARITAADVPGRAINLLAFIKPERDTIRGKWTFTDGALASDDTQRAAIHVPYSPPEEYDFQFTFERLSGNNAVLIFPRTPKGGQFYFQLGCFWNTRAGFGVVRGQHADRNAASVPHQLQGNRRYVATIQVRRDSFAAYVDGRLLVQYRTDYSDVSMCNDWDLGNVGGFVLGSWNSYRFYEVKLRPVTGSGHWIK